MTRIPSMLSILLLAACGTTVSQDEILVSDDDAFGKVGGIVTDTSGAPIADVTVTAQGLSATTDADGVYLIDGLEPGSDFVVEFHKRGYANGFSRSSLISWETAAANKVLLEIDGTDTFDASAGGTVEVGVISGGIERPLTVEFAPDSIVDSLGRPYAGTVVVEITYVDPYDETAEGAPGDLQALAFPEDNEAKEASEPAQLVSYGMAEITLYPETALTDEDGEPLADEELNLDEGEAATVVIPIVNPDASIYEAVAGDSLPTWSFDEAKGIWVEEGEGLVDSDEDGLLFEFEAPHFSWWNSDQGFVPTFACGRVVDYLGFPVRSAEVIARGTQSTSTATTDEDGYYTISVLAGDTVTFTASTMVAGTSDWPADHHTMYIDGGTSRNTCDGDEVPDIGIDVCRESGVVMTDNITSYLSATDATNGDRLRAFFWEAPGDIEYCVNPWDHVGMEDCEQISVDDYVTPHEIDSVDDLPVELRPVGDWLELSTARDTYVLNKHTSNGKPFYTIDTESYSSTDPSYLESNDLDLRGGDALSALAPGDLSAGMGSIDEATWVTIPEEFTSDGVDGPQVMGAGSSLTLNFDAANNGDGILVIGGGVSINDDGQADETDSFMICRFYDDGSITIPGSDMRALNNGATAVSIFRPEIGWTAGPDGLPIRVQAFSGTAVELDIQ